MQTWRAAVGELAVFHLRPCGMALVTAGGMCARRVYELDAFQLTANFKDLIYQLFEKHPAAKRDFKYRDQVYDAISSAETNLCEGFARFKHKQMAVFVRIALGSLEETALRLADGVHRRHFKLQSVVAALRMGHRAIRATRGLLLYLESTPD